MRQAIKLPLFLNVMWQSNQIPWASLWRPIQYVRRLEVSSLLQVMTWVPMDLVFINLTVLCALQSLYDPWWGFTVRVVFGIRSLLELKLRGKTNRLLGSVTQVILGLWRRAKLAMSSRLKSVWRLTSRYNQVHQSTRACDNKGSRHLLAHHQRDDIVLSPACRLLRLAVCARVPPMPHIHDAK